MAISRTIPAAAGLLTLLATSAILILHIILAGCIPHSRAVCIAASVSAALEGVSLSVLAWLVSTYIFTSSLDRSKRFLGAAFAVSVFACALASILSIVTVVLLGNAAHGSSDKVLGAELEDFLVGSSVTLGVAFMSQVAFIVVHFVFTRVNGGGSSIFTIETPAGQAEIKSIPYDQTKSRGDKELDLLSPPGSSSGKSATETMSSIRRSLSSVARPLSMRTALTREKSSSSLTSNLCREGAIPEDPEDPFDTWDTASAHTRQALHASTSRLQTIPASPTVSPSPSFDDLPLEPPPVRRSRSYSPVPRGQYATASDGSEAHIHPLFRSDSPTPPMATPGTVVMASPNAGQVISDRGSLRAGRMRSGSLNTPSPLSRQGSLDDFAPVRPAVREEWGRGTPEGSILESPEEEGERVITPPIPEWILSAGARSSMVDYNRRTRADV